MLGTPQFYKGLLENLPNSVAEEDAILLPGWETSVPTALDGSLSPSSKGIGGTSIFEVMAGTREGRERQRSWRWPHGAVWGAHGQCHVCEVPARCRYVPSSVPEAQLAMATSQPHRCPCVCLGLRPTVGLCLRPGTSY